jgi:hypothetical protein
MQSKPEEIGELISKLFTVVSKMGGDKLLTALKAFNLDKDSIKKLVKEIHEELQDLKKEKTADAVAILFKSAPRKLRLEVFENLTINDQSKIAGISSEMKKIVEFCRFQSRGRQRMKFPKIKDMRDLKETLLFAGKFETCDLTDYPDNLAVIGIEKNKKTGQLIEFFLEGEDYSAKKLLASFPAELLYK